ncbi:MAG: asparagine synthase [Solirubrobacterales bacterium]
MKEDNRGLAVAGVGALVTAAGATLFKKSKWGDGLVGFGLAHVILGLADKVQGE